MLAHGVDSYLEITTTKFYNPYDIFLSYVLKLKSLDQKLCFNQVKEVKENFHSRGVHSDEEKEQVMELYSDFVNTGPDENWRVYLSQFVPAFLELPFIAPLCPNTALASQLLQLFFVTYSSSGAVTSNWQLAKDPRLF